MENHQYDDILYLPRPASRRAKMSMTDRGAQFSPFAALTGYDAVIRESARLTDEAAQLEADEIAALDEKLRRLRENPEKYGEITFRIFQPDEWKSGGSYTPVTGKVRRIDPVRQTVLLEGGEEFAIDAIYAIDGVEEDYGESS